MRYVDVIDAYEIAMRQITILLNQITTFYTNNVVLNRR